MRDLLSGAVAVRVMRVETSERRGGVNGDSKQEGEQDDDDLIPPRVFLEHEYAH